MHQRAHGISSTRPRHGQTFKHTASFSQVDSIVVAKSSVRSNEKKEPIKTMPIQTESGDWGGIGRETKQRRENREARVQSRGGGKLSFGGRDKLEGELRNPQGKTPLPLRRPNRST